MFPRLDVLLLEEDDLELLLLLVEEDLVVVLLEDVLFEREIFRLPELLFILLERPDVLERDLDVLVFDLVVVGLVLVEFVLILEELVPILVLADAPVLILLRFEAVYVFVLRLFKSPETVLLVVFSPLIELPLLVLDPLFA